MTTRLLSTDRPVAIYYAFITEIDSITKVDDSHITVALTGSGWKQIQTTIGTIDLQEETAETDAGTLYTNVLNAILPGHEVTTPEDIGAIAGRQVILRLDYRNGMQKIIGSKISGPKIFIKTSSNTTTSRKIQCNYKTNTPNHWLS